MHKIKRVITTTGTEDVIMHHVPVGEAICRYSEHLFLADVWRSPSHGGMIYLVSGVVVVEITSISNLFRERKSDC